MAEPHLEPRRRSMDQANAVTDNLPPRGGTNETTVRGDIGEATARGPRGNRECSCPHAIGSYTRHSCSVRLTMHVLLYMCVIFRYAQQMLSKGFVSWLITAREIGHIDRSSSWAEACQQAVIARCTKRMAQITTALTFGGWVEAVNAARRHRYVVKVALGRWRNRALGGVLHAWKSRSNVRARRRRVMNCLLQRCV